MEKLTEFRFYGTKRVEAWCDVCKKWIKNVSVEKGCMPGNRTYAYCPKCNTAIARSE